MANLKRQKHEFVQVKNPRSGRYIKIDRTAGLIISHKQTEGPYKNIKIVDKESDRLQSH